MKTNDVLNELIDFYDEEKSYLAKTELYMKKIYKNRTEQNYNTDKHTVSFLLDKIWYYYFDWRNIIESADNLLYWFYQLYWRKELNNKIIDYLEYRKSTL